MNDENDDILACRNCGSDSLWWYDNEIEEYGEYLYDRRSYYCNTCATTGNMLFFMAYIGIEDTDENEEM